MSPTTKRFRPPRRVRQAFGPFRGMRTAIEERASDPALVDYALNMLPDDPEHGGAYVLRPPTVTTSGLPTSTRRGYAVFPSMIPDTDGVETITIAGGAVWSLGAGSTAWTQAVIPTTIAAAGIGLLSESTGGRYHYLVFAGKMLFSDGVNTPWAWDGTRNGGLTKLTNCPVLYGPMTEYAGKLVGIKDADRRTIVWSEENDPTTGYEAGGFNNAWTISQQADENLTRVYGRNDGLYYWRPHSTGMIVGAVAGDFRTTHTQDAVSATVGMQDFDSLVDTGEALWWYATEERIIRYPIGGLPADVSPMVWAVAEERLTPSAGAHWTPSAKDDTAVIVSDVTATLVGPNAVTPREQVWFSLPAFNPTFNSRQPGMVLLVYDARTAQPLGYLQQSGGTVHPGRNLGMAMGAVNIPQFTSPRRVGISDNGSTGAPILWASLRSSPLLNTVEGVLVGPVAGGTDDIELAWLDCAVSTRLPPKSGESPATISLSPSTPSNRSGAPLSTSVAPDPSLVTTGRTVFGLEEIGRWFRPTFRLTWNGVAVGYGIQGYTVSAAGANEDPDAA